MKNYIRFAYRIIVATILLLLLWPLILIMILVPYIESFLESVWDVRTGVERKIFGGTSK
jgi:hypothetical protein